MQQLWQRISYLGTGTKSDLTDYKSVVFLNRICFIQLAFILSSVVINFILRDYNFVIPLAAGAAFLSLTYLLQFTKQYFWARCNVIIVTLGLLSFMLFKAGTGAGIEFYFLCLAMLPAIVFTQKRIIYFFQALCILFLVAQKVHENIFTQEAINDLRIYKIFYIINSIYSGLLIILAITFFKNQHIKSEQELILQKKTIEEKNASLEILNASLFRSNRDLEQFAYVASHDLKEPLRMISSFATLLARKCADTDFEIQEYNKYISQGVLRMQNLINDLLAYAQIGSDEKIFTYVDVNKIIAEVKKNLQLAIDETDTQIKFGHLPKVSGIEHQIYQLFYNLISNAIKFRRTDALPEIIIHCTERAREWLFCVQDNGLGIADNYKDKVFVIFQRLHNTDAYPGTGIGLALCKRIIERHGGKIWLESVPEEGTTFLFTIPKS